MLKRKRTALTLEPKPQLVHPVIYSCLQELINYCASSDVDFSNWRNVCQEMGITPQEWKFALCGSMHKILFDKYEIKFQPSNEKSTTSTRDKTLFTVQE